MEQPNFSHHLQLFSDWFIPKVVIDEIFHFMQQTIRYNKVKHTVDGGIQMTYAGSLHDVNFYMCKIVWCSELSMVY